MNLLRQPNRWTCLPTSFAMVLGVSLEKIISLVGHDGSEVIFPELNEPFKRRSFHIQEMVDVCRKLDHLTYPIEPYSVANHGFAFNHVIQFKPSNEFRALKYLKKHNGVLVGMSKCETPHAVAWNANSERIFNPTGAIETLDTFSMQSFWIVQSEK